MCVIFASGMFFCIYKICIFIYIDTICVYAYGIYLCYCHLHCRCCCLVTCDNLIRGNHQFKLYIPHHTYVVDFVIPLTIHTILDMRPAAHIYISLNNKYTPNLLFRKLRVHLLHYVWLIVLVVFIIIVRKIRIVSDFDEIMRHIYCGYSSLQSFGRMSIRFVVGFTVHGLSNTH